MPVLPSTRDIRHARRQAEGTMNTAVGRVRTPLLAVLGAAEATTQALTDTFTKARGEANQRAQETQHRVQSALTDLQNRVSDLPAELGELRTRLDSAQLRKLADAYADVAQQAYTSLAERGEQVFGEFRSQPRVQRAFSTVESGVDGAQERLEAIVKDVNQLADELRSRFARSSRSAGNKAARRTEEVSGRLAGQVKEASDDVAAAMSEAGEETAASTRSTTRKAAEQTAPQRSTQQRNTAPGNTAQRKPATRRNGSSNQKS